MVVENNNPFEIINIAKDPAGFTGFHGGQPYPFALGEKKVLPKYVAEHCAKQMLDKVLQEEHGQKNSLRETPLRTKLLYTILPWKEADDAKIKREIDLKKNNIDAIVEVQKLASANEAIIKENKELKADVASLSAKMDDILTSLSKKEEKVKKEPKVINE